MESRKRRTICAVTDKVWAGEGLPKKFSLCVPFRALEQDFLSQDLPLGDEGDAQGARDQAGECRNAKIEVSIQIQRNIQTKAQSLAGNTSFSYCFAAEPAQQAQNTEKTPSSKKRDA